MRRSHVVGRLGMVCCLQTVRWGVTVAEAGCLDLCDNKRHSNFYSIGGYSRRGWVVGLVRQQTTLQFLVSGNHTNGNIIARVWQHQARSEMTRFVTGTTHTSPLLPVSSAQTQYRTHSKIFAQDAAKLLLDVLPQVPKAPQLLRPLEHLVRC